ncbi:MAG: hypothetical protein CVV27_17910, partial [Candidatus Melainabacteria bacterium HGW-Melainabacteria-1]
SRLGTSVSGAGDLNGDGRDDLILGAPITTKLNAYAGSAYAVFGSDGLSPGRTIDLYNMGADAIELNSNGAQSYAERVGHSVSGAGDVNGDGFNDLLIGTPNYCYLVYGAANLSQINPLKLLFPFYNPGAGVVLTNPQGSGNFSILSYTVKVSGAGDFNRDGYDDIILGANGEAYVIFGAPSLGSNDIFNAANLNGSNGFRLTGMAEYRSDYTKTVASAGDLNGDGYDDLIVGSPGDSAAYVIFGTDKPFPASLDIRNLTSLPAP